MKMAQIKEIPKPPYMGYESIIYLEEYASKQLYIMKTWYEGATYAQAALSQANIIESFEDNSELKVTYGTLEGIPAERTNNGKD